MEKIVEIWGIETNNLRNLDIELIKHSINLIIGPSGSGKSSLAYDTIAQLGQHEFQSMFSDDIFEPSYSVKGYEGLLVTIPLKQTNSNNNVRSSIGTYFGLNHNICLLYAATFHKEESFFLLNKAENVCDHCHGLGYVNKLDENKIIDFNIPLDRNPFRCWNRYKDFYCEIITKFCFDNNIDSSKTFRELSNAERELILYGESEKKYSIKYKKLNSLSSRTTKFYGVMTNKPMLPNFNISQKFYSERTCSHCGGKKYSPTFDQYKLSGISIGEFMTTPFSDLVNIFNRISKDGATEVLNELSFLYSKLKNFVEKCIELNLGHLYFNRSIPSLSGGELQRLRLVQIFNTQLSDMLIVLDEPLAGLSKLERAKVYANVLALVRQHTLVIVDHGDSFVSKAKKIIALGPGSGKYGGKLIDVKSYLTSQNTIYPFVPIVPHNFYHISLRSCIYNYKGACVTCGENCLNIIYGQSGIGKSTLLREYFVQYFSSYEYINQKPINGNINSSVSTVLGVFDRLILLFAKKYNKDKHFFSNQTGDPGACPTCNGAGYVEYVVDNKNSTKILCKDCMGTGFTKQLKKYVIDGKNIFDIWKMTIDEFSDFIQGKDKKIDEILYATKSLLLNHLIVGQPTSTLSGGENIRIKLLKHFSSSVKIIGIDEPFKGLNNSEIYKVILFLDSLRTKGKTLIVVDHTEQAFRYFPVCIELVDDAKILKGIIKDFS